MDPVLDGTGGGYGKHRGLPVREVLAIFDRSAEKPSMRSVRTIIRVGREQVEARGQMQFYVPVAIVTAVLGVFSFTLTPASPIQVLSRLGLSLEVPSTVPFLPFGISALMLFAAFTTRKTQRFNNAQEKLIRDGAIGALATIAASSDFRPEELDWSERNALKKLAGRRPMPL